MNNLLIPTDFTTSSVQLATKAVRTLKERTNIVFFHAFELPYFYNDTLSSQPPYVGLMNDRLRQACRQLKDQFPDLIGTITFRFMRGNTNALFRNFIEANNITMIVCPVDYFHKKVHEDSINPTPFFRRCKLPLLQNFNTGESALAITEKMNLEIATAS